ncbi:MAG: GCN5-related N-acetyltransferase [Solirubrobacterales bacterium]|jgi:ribosomal-protein-alanine N-acetyltransferase|nr:GCN5-related N-acetyltransferase [Solirubrobacterales bacterium]
MVVTGPTLTLRFATEADAPALLDLAGDPDVTRFFSWGPYEDLSEPLGYIRRLAGQRERGEQLDLLVVHREHGPVGVTGLSELSRRDRRAIVGTWLGREFWGTGANAESKRLVAHLAFAVLGLERLGAYASTENRRSQVALERLGYEREGVLRAWHRHGDRVHDVVLYSLLQRDYAPEIAADVRGAPPEAFVLP